MRKLYLPFTLAISTILLSSVSCLHAQDVDTPVILNGDMNIVVEKFAQFPDYNDSRPRINSFTFFGDRNFASDESGGRIFEIIEDASTGQNSLSLFHDVRIAIPLNTGRDMDQTNTTHGGLRDVAFHPDFLTNGKFYTSVMEDRPSDTSSHHYLSDAAEPITADGVLIEWTYDHSINAVDVYSYREVFRIGMPVFDHPIKNITFNQFAEPDDEDYGLLYISHGDGSIQSATAGGGQNNDGLGKIIRINPLETESSLYSIPTTNPYVENPDLLDELYAIGFRNPHNIRFNKDINGNVYLICADAGRDNIEEINIIQAGENYGWSEREGTFVHIQSGGGIINGISSLPDNDADFEYTYPSSQWIHTGAIGAGFVGQAIAGGVYYIDQTNDINHCLFGDFAVSGRLFYNNMLDLVSQNTKLSSGESPDLLTQSQVFEYSILFDDDNDISTPALSRENMLDVVNDESTFSGSRADLRFGNDEEGNVYITSKSNGWIYKVQNIYFNDNYEAEDAITNAEIGSTHDDFQGTGYVENIIALQKYVEFTVNAPQAGLYDVDLRYAAGANGPSTTRTMSVYLNDTDVLQAEYPLTDSWSTWSNQVSQLLLVEGENTIRYQRDSDDLGWINLDFINISLVSLEAEDATTNAEIGINENSLQGVEFVENIIATGKFVEFKVNVSQSGLFDVDLSYAAGTNGPNTTRTMSIYLNNTDVLQAEYPLTGSWNTWSNQVSQLLLLKGENTIRYQKDSDDLGWINLDLISISPVLLEAETTTSNTFSKLENPIELDSNLIQLAPNPTTDILNINLSNYMNESIEYNISSITGKKIEQGKWNSNHENEEQLKVSHLQEGLYIIYIQPSVQNAVIMKFIISKNK